jgi:DNA-binding transcriptional ArsR family regulator
MFRVRLSESPMPTGSKDPDVLLAWLLDSMGLVRRKTEGASVGDEQGALHRLLRETVLVDPLRGWDAKALGDSSGLSQTGVHHQLVKLRESGLLAADIEGRWHIHVLRGGSISAAIGLVSMQARAILDLRLSELAEVISESDDRMAASSEDEEVTFRIEVAEPGVAAEGEDRFDALVRDLGLSGERAKPGDRLSRSLLEELASSGRAITLLALADKCGDSRARVQRSVERMRVAGIVERVPMLDRIAQDVYGGLMRQHDARGEEWLMTRGGVGRLDDSVSKALISGVRKKSLNIEKVQKILGPVPLGSQKVLLNTLGGRMPHGVRIAGRDGAAVKERVMRRADRTLRRMRTVAQRLDEALA